MLLTTAPKYLFENKELMYNIMKVNKYSCNNVILEVELVVLSENDTLHYLFFNLPNFYMYINTSKFNIHRNAVYLGQFGQFENLKKCCCNGSRKVKA